MDLTKKEQPIQWYADSNLHENRIRQEMPKILDILLIDRTTTNSRKTHNIIWAHDNYVQYGEQEYKPSAEIKPHLVTGSMGDLIKPRALKSKDTQQLRTKTKAEVFTPSWIVKKQNDEIDLAYKSDDLETYVRRTWLEITAGEAPYMASRYEMGTGEIIPLEERVGFVDRKLRRINEEVDDKAEWQRLVSDAYKASYGFEWSGDSLLLARENLLYTYRDYYYSKWQEEPIYGLFEDIAEIISYNLFQMDGLKYIIPLTERRTKVTEVQMSLFDDEPTGERWELEPGKRVKVMNWEKNKMEFFDKGVK